MSYQNDLNMFSMDETELMLQTLNLRKNLLCFTLIDLCFNIINGISMTNLHFYWVNFIFGIFIILGMSGINKYNKSLSNCYGIYLILQIIGRFIFLFNFILNIFSFILMILMIFINIWILKLLFTFTNNIKNLSDDALLQLIQGWNGKQQIIITTL